jgi:hypothetical protein
MDAGLVVVLAVLGVFLLVPWSSYMSNGVFNYVVYRRRRKAEESAQAQVEDRAEPGGPAAGG